jgi:hypothetical protein
LLLSGFRFSAGNTISVVVVDREVELELTADRRNMTRLL